MTETLFHWDNAHMTKEVQSVGEWKYESPIPDTNEETWSNEIENPRAKMQVAEESYI